MNTRSALHDQRAAHRNPVLRRRLLPVLIAGCFGTAMANPTGPQVVNGQVGFVTQGNTLSITNSPGAIINWQNFSIEQNEITRFLQQNPNSAVLNRIIGQDPSRILGALQSNGRVFLINPNGILFGQGAQVDVNGLVASTLNIGNDDFIKGKWNFQAGDKAGNLKNEGAITTPSGGQVYLIAPNVENSGIITSPKGEVLLAAGRSVQLVDSTNPDLHVVVSAPEDSALNLGQIIAQSGKAGIYGALVTQRGTVNANSAAIGENGKVIFKASRDTILDAGSRTTATGAGKGGEVQVLGDRVALLGDAKIDASGQQGGGTVLVGGDYQGKNPLVRNASRTYVGAGTEVKADALEQGDGGKVIVWSDEATRAYGTISARGGKNGGNGGFAEVSGKDYLDFQGHVNLDAQAGKAGTLLLDPSSITITNATTADVTEDPANTFTSIGTSSIVNANTLSTQLASNDVIVKTTGGGITVAYPLNWSGSAKSLTLDASGDVAINASSIIGGSGSDLILKSTSGNITQTGYIATTGVQATATVGSVALNHASNTFSTIAGSAGSTFNIKTSSSLDVGSSGITAGGQVTLNATGGAVTQNGVISAPTLDVTASSDVTLTNANSVSSLAGNAGASFKFTNGTTDLAVTSLVHGANYDATIVSDGALTISGWDSWSGGTRTLTAAGNLTINQSVSGGSASDTLVLSSTGGDITQSAALGTMKVSATATAGKVQLDNTSNTISSVSGSASTTFTVKNAEDFTVNSGNISANGVTLLTASGKKIETIGTVDGGSGTVSITAPSQFKVNSGGAVSGNAVSVVTDSLSLSDTVTSSTKLTVKPDTAGTDVDIRTTADMANCTNGALCANFSKLSAATYDFSTNSTTAGNITAGSSLSSLSLGSSKLALTAGDSVTIDGAITGTSQLLARAITGDVTQGASGAIGTSYLIAYADAGTVTLTNSGNSVTKLAGYAGSGGSGFSFANSGDLTLGVIAPVTAFTTAVAGVKAINQPITITAAGNLTIDLTHSLDFNANGYGVYAGTGDIDLTASSGAITSSTSTARITGGSAKLTAVSGIYGSSSSDPLQTNVGTLYVVNSGSGAINITNSSNLEILDIGETGNGIQQASGEAVAVTAASGKTLTVSSPISAANGTVALTADRITLSDTVTANTVSLAQTTSSTPIDVGATVGTDTSHLELGVSDLNMIHVANLVIGNTSSGALQISNPLSKAASGALENVSSMVKMKSGSSITQASGATVTASAIGASFSAPSVTVNDSMTVSDVSIDTDSLSFGASGSIATDATNGVAGIHPYTSGLAITVGGSCATATCLALTKLYKIDSPTIGIGSSDDEAAGAITVKGITAPGASTDTDRNSKTTRIGLLSGAGITQTGAIDVTDLGVKAGGTVNLASSTNHISNLAGYTSSGSFSFKNDQGFQVTSLSGSGTHFSYSLSGLSTSNDDITLTVDGSSTAQLSIASQIDAGSGNVVLSGSGSVSTSGTTIKVMGTSLTANAGGGINLKTKVQQLSATNTDSSTNIVITNNSSSSSGALEILNVTQPAPSNGNSTGNITIDNYGTTTVSGTVKADQGGISITAHSPLTVNGSVSTTSGAITLSAASSTGGSDNLSFGGSSSVTSTTGAITLTAGTSLTLASGAAISSSSGAVALNAGGSISGVTSSNVTTSGTLSQTSSSSSSSTSTSTTTATPTVSQCTANPTLSGCSSVLPSVTTCTTAPSTAGCTAVLPSVSTCTTAPTTAGCSAVLPTVDQCTSAPTTAGCTAVLPSLTTCTATPTAAGCSAVLPSLSNCTTTPTLDGCSAVLPSISTCTTAPATAGCTAVLPSLSTCTTTPTAAGCSAVLPSLSSCTTTPTLAGCSAVLPSVSTCTATPTAAGCTAVLPSIGTCTTAPATAGCTAVLPSLSTCTTTPTAAGCSAVLPSLSSCTTTPTLAGCSAVLPSVSTCTATPTAAGCSAVLPSLSSCTTNPTQAGCSAVLPSLSQCSENLTLTGCSAVLPSISQCASNPNTAGCSVVLPTASKCTITPTLPGCEIVLPPSKTTDTSNSASNNTTQATADAVKDTSNEVTKDTNTVTTYFYTTSTGSPLQTSSQNNSGGSTTKVASTSEVKSSASKSDDSKKDDAKKDEKKETAGPQDDGAKKNDTAKKLYCN